MRPKSDAAWMLGLFCLALVLRAGSVLALRFDGLYGQDPFAYYTYAVGPLRSALLAGQPLPPFFWPPGYPLLIAVGSLALGTTPLIGQTISMLAGSLVPVLTYALARELWTDASMPRPNAAISTGYAAAGLAGLLVALHPQLWQSSVVVMADTTGLAAGTLGAWALARFWRSGQFGWVAVGSAATAYAVLTRWAYALVAVPLALLALWRLWQELRARQLAAVAQAAGALLIAGLVLSPVARSVAASASEGTPFVGDLEVYSWNPLNALRREFVTSDGALSYRLPNGLYYGLLPVHPYYFTPVLAGFLLPGAWALRRWRAPLAWGVLIGWPVIVLGFHAGAPWQNFRFGLATLPPLAILAALGVTIVVFWAGKRWQAMVSVLVLAGLGWMAWGGWTLTRSFAERKQRELDIVAAVEASAPPSARLLTFNLTSTFQYYSGLETLELWALEVSDLEPLLVDDRPTLLLINVDNVESQWQGRSPALNFHWLRDGPGLDQLGRYEDYTLFRVRCACP